MFIPKEIKDPLSGEIIVVMTEKVSNIANRFEEASRIQKKMGINLASYGTAKKKPQNRLVGKVLHKHHNKIITKNMKNVLA